MSEIVVAATGVANVASVMAALERAGARPRLTTSAEDVEQAGLVVLPGVGSFGAAMEALRASGLAGPLADRAARGRPLLAICLGMQLLAERSDESPGVRGLAVFPGTVRRYEGAVRVPQLGWNVVTPAPGSRLLEAGWASFANSYRLADIPAGWTGATADHGGRFAAAVERGAVLGCQFHPELSGDWGLAVIRRWIDVARGGQWTESSGQWAVNSGQRVTGAVRIIPCLDCDGGRVVKGIRFAGLRDAGDPVARAAAYEAQGADELVLLDVSATPEGRGHQLETVRAVRRVLGIPLTAGGGVRTPDDVARLLEAGADKVAVNTAAFRNPALLSAMADRFGVQCTVLAVDAARIRPVTKTSLSGRRQAPPLRPDAAGPSRPPHEPFGSQPAPAGWEVVIESGRTRTGCDAVGWTAEAVRRGAGEILLTSFDRDGTREGYDLALIEAASRAVPVPVIASGGAETPGHLLDAVRAGADAVLAASIFHDGERTAAELKDFLASRGVRVRLRSFAPSTSGQSRPDEDCSC